jgi:hypothetical protein
VRAVEASRGVLYVAVVIHAGRVVDYGDDMSVIDTYTQKWDKPLTSLE